MLDNYEQLPNGVIKQITKVPFTYDYNYSNNYNSHGEKNTYLNYLRFGVLIGAIGYIPNSIVDIGYGNGEFLKICTSKIKNVYGCDVSDYPVPDNCFKIKLYINPKIFIS